MTDLKEKGLNIQLSNIIIHKINKLAGEKKSVLKIADKEILIGNHEIRFIADVRESFQKKSVPTHGIFNDEIKFNGFQQALGQYIDNKIDFIKFSESSMEYYKKTIDTSAPATGGFLIFADFKVTDNNERFILVLAINNKEGYNLSETSLTIESIKSLELNKMDLASSINISRWKKFKEESDARIKTYLTFIRGKKKISDYFQNFIGCDDKTTATESSSRLIEALDKYFEENLFDKPKSLEIKNKVLDYCQNRNKSKSEILLTHISSIVNEDDPEKFLHYASSERFSNSEVIKYDSRILRSLKYIEYRSENFNIKFNKNLIGSNIKLKSGVLTISNLPEELLKQF